MKRLLILILIGVLLAGCEGGVYVPNGDTYIPRAFRHFGTVSELKEWLSEEETYLSSRETAFHLQKRAAEDGYLLSASVFPLEYTLYGLPITNIALIGDSIYTIREGEVELWFIFTSYP